MQQSGWPAYVLLGCAAALTVTFATWTPAAQTSTWNAVATTRVPTTYSMAVGSQPRSVLSSARSEVAEPIAEGQVPYVASMAPAFATPSSSWSSSIVGVVGVVAAAIVGGFLGARSKNQEQLLQPLMMISIAGSADYKAPNECLNLFLREGYSILDIRSEMEGAEGRIRSPNKGSVDIPLFSAKAAWDSSVGRKVVKQEVNPKWLEQVRTKFAKDAKIIVMCSDGDKRTSQALDLLAAEGFKNLIAMNGGFNKFDQLYDRQFRPRTAAAQASKAATLKDTVEWGQWAQAVGVKAPPRVAQAAAPAPVAAPVSAAPAPSSVSASRVGVRFQDPAFQAATLAAFPAKANADAEEARILWKLGGYALLDIRSDMEGAEGRVRGPNKGSIDIPMFTAKASYDSTLGKKVVKQEVNSQWLEQVKARFPKDAKIIVMCSDGTTRSSQALDLLAAEGYTNLVLLVGGYSKWDQLFDKRLGVRSAAQQQSKGEWLADPIQWGVWASAAGVRAPPARAAPAYVAPPPAPVAAAAPVAAPVTPAAPRAGPSYLDPTFQAATIAAFPAKAIATVEEARVLWKLGGYSILDIRSEMEGADGGRIRGPNKGTIDIPMFNARAVYDSALGKKVVKQEVNSQWLEQVKARFPKDAKIIVMCSDGRKRSTQALETLEAAGYTNLVGLIGGYNKWDQVFDRKLGPRPAAQQQARAANLRDNVEWGRWGVAVRA